jgi:Glucodextranase, domain B
LLEALSVAFPADGTAVTNGSVALSGTAADSLSGVGEVTCNSLEAAVAGNSSSCRLRLSVGSNAIQVQGVDFAGNVATTTINVMYNLDPSPSALFLTPDHFALGMSETRTLVLIDDLGRVIPASGWAVSDTTVALVAADGTITPVAAGTATVTGSYQGLSATAQLTVYGTPGLPPATVHWFCNLCRETCC